MSVSTRVEDGILVVTIANAPVNALSVEVRAGLLAAIKEKPADVVGVVITGAGRNFIGGADIREFDRPAADPILPEVIAALDALDLPLVAAINGAALGGGLEVALACHARIAAAEAKLGLPEVKLGIVPGAGGTQRLPRLIGLAPAIELIATGAVIPAERALALGMIDAVASGDIVAAAISRARERVGQPPRRTSALPVPVATTAEVDAVQAKALAKTKGQAAPIEAARLVRLASGVGYEAGLAEERASFLRLKASDEAAALRHVFFAERAAAKIAFVEGVSPRPVATIGVVGLGLMGSGIATAALDAGYAVIGADRTGTAAEEGRERITGLIDRALKAGRVTAEGRADRLARLLTSSRLEDLAPCDLVIEAVFDDLGVKTALFAALEPIVRADAVLATNTSYLDPNAIAAAIGAPERVIGLHFFSPAHVMRLVELVRCAKTAPDALATGLAVAKRLGKLAIPTGVCEGFIGNRIFSAYRREAEFVLEEGAAPHEIDAAMEAFGMAMGPFAVFDLAGFEIAWARRKAKAATRDPGERYVDIPDRLCEAGRLGQRSGLGWYAYPDGKRTIDPAVAAIIAEARAAKGVAPRAIPPEEIVARLLAAMAAEGAALLLEGVAERPGDIDLVLINGYGFPAHRGGPMFIADREAGR